jgi:hypothetical protein
VGKKSRAKRLAREGLGPHRELVHSRGRQDGFGQANRWYVLGAVLIVALGLAFILKSALGSTSSATNRASTPASMSGEQGILVGKHVAMASMALPSSSGGNVALNKYRGKKLVVYFYEGVT